MDASLPGADLVLIGAGHTNMHVVRMWRMQPIPDVRLTLVSPFSRATYSGMLPGTLAGLYPPEAMSIDLWRFCASCGVRLIVAEATGLDPAARHIEFSNRPPVRYDAAVVGIGSVPTNRALWERNPAVLSIKPMATFLQRLEGRLRDFEQTGGRGRSARVIVVGAGAAGVEVSFCLDAYLRKRGTAAELTLVDSGPRVLKGYRSRTAELAEREFERRGIRIVSGESVADVQGDQVRFQSGRTSAADLVIWAASAAPPPVLGGFDLPKADDGFLAVRPTLQSAGDDAVFVVGDTATFPEHPLPKAGVYAVREGPVLWENLRRFFRELPLESYDPQKGFLSLLSTGDGRAIAEYKGLSAHGAWAWRWKDHIDRKFMRKYQDYRPMSPEMMASRNGKPRNPGPSAMRCKGCGGKVGSRVLSAALERLTVRSGTGVARGLDRPDDAAILEAGGAAEVISVDFFQAFLDDPFLVGRVAALNALSDLWATNATPTGAMAMVTLGEGPSRQQTDLLYQLLAGGERELSAAGATLLGGHTTEGAELTIGYTVLGRMEGRRPWTKDALQSGDRLILTKPLGTGVLLAAHMQAACRAGWLDRMLATMLLGNAAAAKVAREFDVCAVTDITGFGLAGHLLEMLRASGVDARVTLGAIPLLDGFAELSGKGIRSSLDPSNRESEHAIDDAARELRTGPQYDALFDPQTSGGLLIAARPEFTDALVARLREAGYDRAVVIGEVLERSADPRLKLAP